MPEVPQPGSTGVRIRTQVWLLPEPHTAALRGSGVRWGQYQEEEGAGVPPSLPGTWRTSILGQLNNLSSSALVHAWVPGLFLSQVAATVLNGNKLRCWLLVFTSAADLSAFMTSSPLKGNREQKTGPYVMVVLLESYKLSVTHVERERERDGERVDKE